MRDVPRALWGEGPWLQEPDEARWVHRGVVCVALRNLEVTGSWCGYASVAPGHPFWGKRYDECVLGCPPQPKTEWPEPAKDDPAHALWEMQQRMKTSGTQMAAFFRDHDTYACDHAPEDFITVHGGLTFGGPGYNHGLDVSLWWFGFDCGHAWDYAPKMHALLNQLELEKPWKKDWGIEDGPSFEVYRDLPFVKHEVNRMARQLVRCATLEAVKSPQRRPGR